MALNWFRSPLSHFEKWQRVVNAVKAAFWKEEHPDVDETIKEVMNLPFQPWAYNKKLSDEQDRAAATYLELVEAKRNRLVSIRENFEEMKRFIDNETKRLQENPGADVSAKHTERLKKKEAEYLYLKNGGDETVILDGDGMFAEMLIFLHDFNWCGRKMFRVEEQLTHELTLTHVDGVLAEFFRLPFQTICIHFPHNEGVCIQGHPVRWAYLSEYEEEENGGARHLHMMYVMEDGYPHFHDLVLSDNEGLGKQLTASVSEKYKGLRTAIKEHRQAFGLIAALILYMNSTDRDVRELRPSVTNPNTDSRIPVCSLGGSIRVDKTLYVGSAEGEHAAHTIHILKWAVRGHFRNQVHGKGRAERRIQWIRPFLKGRERSNPAMPMRPAGYAVPSELETFANTEPDHEPSTSSPS